MIVKLAFPSPLLFPNRKHADHWTKAHAAKVKARDDAFYATKQAASGYKPPAGYIPLSVLFVTPTRVRRDWDGLAGAFKPQQDGIALALQIDDSRFKPVLIDWAEGEKPGAVIVTVGAVLYNMPCEIAI